MSLKLKLPDPAAVAKAEADQINRDRHQFLVGPVDRVLADSPNVDRDSLLQGLAAFHRERMQKIPSVTKYPESPPWVENTLAIERELRARANLNDLEIAVRRSLGDYLTFRGYVNARRVNVEKCRVAYLPDTDQGQMHIKNVDDPDTFWVEQPPIDLHPAWVDPPQRDIVWDGVGSGMHIDDEPDEIFPLSPPRMYRHYADDVPSAVDFLTRYSSFWGGQNIVLHDPQKRSVAIEKCSYNHIEVFYPDRTGRSWCSGMATRDPNSLQGKYQRAQRERYLKMFDMGDCADIAFWNACDTAEKMLSTFLTRQGPIRVQEVLDLFTTPFPKGLCKTGAKFHPQQSMGEYTLITMATTWTENERRQYCWSRGGKPALTYPSKPQIAISRKPGA